MNYLEMKHIKKHFDELEVLKDISLNVREGQVVAIIGLVLLKNYTLCS